MVKTIPEGIITINDVLYPSALKALKDAPKQLYFRGNIALLQQQKIAIVGSRDSSSTSIEYAKLLALDAKKHGFVVVSGGAKGIDIAAHMANPENTICVFGTGLNHPYPYEHKQLFEKIVNSGGLLISEYPPEFKGEKYSFVKRNRITSGLSEAVYIVTSNVVGGTMAQAKIAFTQQKKYMCHMQKRILTQDYLKLSQNMARQRVMICQLKNQRLSMQQSDEKIYKQHM